MLLERVSRTLLSSKRLRMWSAALSDCASVGSSAPHSAFLPDTAAAVASSRIVPETGIAPASCEGAPADRPCDGDDECKPAADAGTLDLIRRCCDDSHRRRGLWGRDHPGASRMPGARRPACYAIRAHVQSRSRSSTATALVPNCTLGADQRRLRQRGKSVCADRECRWFFVRHLVKFLQTTPGRHLLTDPAVRLPM